MSILFYKAPVAYPGVWLEHVDTPILPCKGPRGPLGAPHCSLCTALRMAAPAFRPLRPLDASRVAAHCLPYTGSVHAVPFRAHAVQLADFGLSLVVDTEAGGMTKTMVGTPNYMSPDVLQVGGRKRGGVDDTRLGTWPGSRVQEEGSWSFRAEGRHVSAGTVCGCRPWYDKTNL